MTENLQKYQQLLESLSMTTEQLSSIQAEIDELEQRLQTARTTLSTSVETMGSVNSIVNELLNEASHQASEEQIRENMATALDEMSQQMSEIVNRAREQMLQPQKKSPEPTSTLIVEPTDPIEPGDEKHDLTRENELLQMLESGKSAQKTAENVKTEIEPLNGEQVGEKIASSLEDLGNMLDHADLLDLKPMSLPKGNDPLQETLSKAKDVAEELDDMAKEAGMTSDQSEPTIIAEGETEDDEDHEAVEQLLQHTSSSFVATHKD